MPIYEYRCQSCQHELEIMQKMADAPLVRCPSCGQDSLTKLISRSSFQLKGTGWYATDFKSPAKTPAENNSTETTKNTDTASSSTTPATTTSSTTPSSTSEAA